MSMGPLVVLILLMSVKCFFHELPYVKKSEPTFFVVIFFVICLTVNNLSGILDTTDTSFMQPCQTGLKQGQMGPNSAKPGQTGPNIAK